MNKQLIKGIISYFPWLFDRVFPVKEKTSGTFNARIAYSLFMRHLVKSSQNNCLESFPKNLVEIGPGASLGMGLTGVLLGIDRYYAFDAINFTTNERNLKVFDEILAMVTKREAIPDNSEFPFLGPGIESYQFPDKLISEAQLERALHPDRIAKIRMELSELGRKSSGEGQILHYYAPWDGDAYLNENSIDFICASAVFEHVEDISGTYDIIHKWLKKGGVFSNQVDLKSHGTHPLWNGHYTYSPFVWKLMKGKRSFLLNRNTLSEHIYSLDSTGFTRIVTEPVREVNVLKKGDLAENFKEMSEGDLTTRSVYFLCRK